jgi:hypothetical protein
MTDRQRQIPSRRAVLAGITATPALALPALAASATALPPATGRDAAATLHRLEQMIDILRTRVVCKGWHPNGLDETAAARTLAYFRAGFPEESEEDFVEREAVFDFIYGHGQSMDWIILGDPVVLICRAAEHSRRAQLVAPTFPLSGPDPIFAAIERHRVAAAALYAASEAHDTLEERLVEEAGSPANQSDRWYEAIHAADRDPQYVKAEAVTAKSSDAEIDAAWALVAEPPATIAGAGALAAYALEYKGDYSWPDQDDRSDDFAGALLRSLSGALSARAVS